MTVTVGGNDVFEPVLRACAPAPQDDRCRSAVTTALQRADEGVDRVLRALTDAVPAGTTVAVMTYYDPVPACRLAPLHGLAEQVLEGAGRRPGLNDVIRRRVAQRGAVVVETGQRLVAPRDFVGGDDCLHPGPSGHERIARAFADTTADRVAVR